MNEKELAIMEASMAGFVADYFKARPQLMHTISEERLVEAGFKDGWAKCKAAAEKENRHIGVVFHPDDTPGDKPGPVELKAAETAYTDGPANESGFAMARRMFLRGSQFMLGLWRQYQANKFPDGRTLDPMSPSGQHRHIAHILMAMASQENCDGEPYDQMQFAAEYIQFLERRLIEAEQDVWLPMMTAPRDGTLLRLLVDFEDHATENSDKPSPTIGHNEFDHNGEDEWHFVGWCWSHDHFTGEPKGKVIGWLPIIRGDATIARQNMPGDLT